MNGNAESLIERLERASGPDGYLDFQIDIAIKGLRNIGGGWCENILTSERVRSPFTSPLYTSSIDAALTLVPEGFAWSAGSCWLSDDAWVVPDYNSPIHGERLRRDLGEPVKGEWTDSGIDVALHPSGGRVAIALCIVALKARNGAEP